MQLAVRTKSALLLCAVLVPILAMSLCAQEEPPANYINYTDTVFSEIELSPEGVVAFDTAGNRWRYDFEVESFVEGDQDEITEGRPDDDFRLLPAEERCTEEKTIKSPQNRVLVGYDEYVDGDIQAIGRITIRGWVKGNVQSLGGRVLVTESGRVDGDIMAPSIVVKPGAEVLGELVETPEIGSLPDIITGFSTAGIWVLVGFTIFLLVAGFVIVALAPNQLRRFRQCAADYTLRCFSMGLLFLLLLPMIIALLAITIVGLMVIPFVPLVYLLAMTMGIISVSHMAGGSLLRRFGRGDGSDMFNILVGLSLIILLWLVVAILLGASDPVSQGFGVFFLVVACTVMAFPICTGIGAAFLTRVGSREYVSFRRRMPEDESAAPTPPPIPDEPPIVTPPSSKSTDFDDHSTSV